MALGRADERAAGLDGRAGELVVEDPAADPAAGLEQQYVVPLLGEVAGGDQAGDATADDHDVDPAGQRALPGGGGDGVVERSGAESESGAEQESAGHGGGGGAHARGNDGPEGWVRRGAVRLGTSIGAVIRAAVADAARALASEGLLVGTAGNVSARDGDRVAVTGTGVVLADCTPDDVTEVSLAGDVLGGALVPTSELDLHLAVYAATGAGAVVHTHAPYSTAVACVLDELPVLHYQQLLLGGAIPVAPYATFGTAALAASVVAALEGRQAALMANHGSVAVGGTLDQAVEQRAAPRVAGHAPPPGQRARDPAGAHRRAAGGRDRPGAAAQLRHHPGERMKIATVGVHVLDTHVLGHRVHPGRLRRSAGRDDPDVRGGHGRRHGAGAQPTGRGGRELRRGRHRPDRHHAAGAARGRGRRHQRAWCARPTSRPRRRSSRCARTATGRRGTASARTARSLVEDLRPGGARRDHPPAPRRPGVPGRRGGRPAAGARPLHRRRDVARHPRSGRPGHAGLDRRRAAAHRLPAAERRAGARLHRRLVRWPTAPALWSTPGSAASL